VDKFGVEILAAQTGPFAAQGETQEHSQEWLCREIRGLRNFAGMGKKPCAYMEKGTRLRRRPLQEFIWLDFVEDGENFFGFAEARFFPVGGR
jgi:hypothetical protein